VKVFDMHEAMPFDVTMIGRCIRNGFGVVLALCLCCADASGDSVTLTNGQVLEGVIVKQTPNGLILNIGGGTTTIASNKIASVKRTAEAANTQFIQNWNEKNFLNRKNVPDGMERLAAEFRTLLDAREEAIRSQRVLSTMDGREKAINAAIDELSNRLNETGKKIAGVIPSGIDGIDAYNATVYDMNSIAAERNVKSEELKALTKSRQNMQEQVAGYVQSMMTFKSSFPDRAAELKKRFKSSDTGEFLSKVENKLIGLTSEFQTSDIRVASLNNGSKIVSAMINDKIRVRLLVDTGAATVMLPESIAKRLNLDLDQDSRKKVELVMADGSKVTASAVTLDSLQVGDARAEKVDAVIIKVAGTNDIEGLLGMSFLRNFEVEFRGDSIGLTLRKFTPKQ
jgi:clan AA aspartic protease (TIGR02281 family)